MKCPVKYAVEKMRRVHSDAKPATEPGNMVIMKASV
jgi:hypothetical protein